MADDARAILAEDFAGENRKVNSMRGKDNTRTGGEILIDQLSVQGVRHAFCVPGESYLAALDAFYGSDIKLMFVATKVRLPSWPRAVGKVTGRPGICFVTRGPGATNASAGIHIARQDSSPMIVSSVRSGARCANAKRFRSSIIARSSARSPNGRPKSTTRANPGNRVSCISYCLQRAPRPGGDRLPEDMLRERVSVADAAVFAPTEITPGKDELSRLQEMLAESKRPVALIGGSRWTERQRRQ